MQHGQGLPDKWQELKQAVSGDSRPAARGYQLVPPAGLKRLVLDIEPSAAVRRGPTGYRCFLRGSPLDPFDQPNPMQCWQRLGRHLVRQQGGTAA